MAKDIDLLAGTKRVQHGHALMRKPVGKPAYGGAGEAIARALLGGMAGVIEKNGPTKEERARGASEGGSNGPRVLSSLADWQLNVARCRSRQPLRCRLRVFLRSARRRTIRYCLRTRTTA